MKNILTWSTAILGILLVSACATIPQKTSPDDCLVVIKVRSSNPEHLKWARQYRLEFTPAYPGLNVPNNERDVVFVVKEPSVLISKITSRITEGGAVGPMTEHNVKVDLPYAPGGVVVADFVIVRRLESAGAYSFREFFDFAPTTDDDRAQALAVLKANPAFAAWSAEP